MLIFELSVHGLYGSLLYRCSMGLQWSLGKFGNLIESYIEYAHEIL